MFDGLKSECYDVVILGGGLAGASAGLLIMRERPGARVLIVERGEAFNFKVGESTSEIAGYFLSQVLGLSNWLGREHIAKNGLRFWFNGGGNTALDRCVEVGSKLQVRLPAWQLDRSKLDAHVLELAVAAGCEVWRPATVTGVAVDGPGLHRLHIRRKGQADVNVETRWVLDASGKAAVMGRKRGTLEPLEEHPTNSLWCRFMGVGDLDGPAFAAAFPSVKKRIWTTRHNATNHITGDGWWAWIIPLQGGEVSVGMTYDRRIFSPPGGSIPERLKAVLGGHPVGAWLMQDAEPVVQDAHFYSQVAYRNAEVAGRNWMVVGDAAGFMDPLYSHGIDFIANTVVAARQIICRSLAGADTAVLEKEYAVGVPTAFMRWFYALYKDKYEYIGDAELMHASVLMDIGSYFIGPVRLTYMMGDEQLAKPFYDGAAGAGFARFMALYNRRLARIGAVRRELGLHGYRNTEGQRLLDSFQPDPSVLKQLRKGVGIWMRAEAATLWHRLTRQKSVTMPLPSAQTVSGSM